MNDTGNLYVYGKMSTVLFINQLFFLALLSFSFLKYNECGKKNVEMDCSFNSISANKVQKRAT